MKTNIEDKICDECELMSVQNEFHVIFECTGYKNLRECFIHEYNAQESSVHVLKKLMENSNFEIINNLAIFLSIVFKDK